MDNKEKIGNPDRDKINVNEEYESTAGWKSLMLVLMNLKPL